VKRVLTVATLLTRKQFCNYFADARYEVLKAAFMKIRVFWDTTRQIPIHTASHPRKHGSQTSAQMGCIFVKLNKGIKERKV